MPDEPIYLPVKTLAQLEREHGPLTNGDTGEPIFVRPDPITVPLADGTVRLYDRLPPQGMSRAQRRAAGQRSQQALEGLASRRWSGHPRKRGGA